MVAFRLQLFLSKTLATFARSASSSHHPCRSFAGVLADGFASDSKQQRATPSSSTRGVEPFEVGGGFGGVSRSRRLESGETLLYHMKASSLVAVETPHCCFRLVFTVMENVIG
jgi:hypothetical protein